jgi:short-subunit dehydrogenase
MVTVSKFAIRGLTEALQTELVDTNVSVLIVHPGGVKTNIIKHAPDIKDAQQRDHAHEVFTQAAFLTSEKAAEKILHAVKKKKRQLVFGTDAVIVNAIRGMFPGRFPGILQAVFGRMTFN